jgi:hypothetical protein
MNALWRLLTVSVIVLLTAAVVGAIGVKVYQTRKIEAKSALLEEANFLDLASLSPGGDSQRAARIVKLLSGCLDPRVGYTYTRPALRDRVAEARALAISNLVTWLQEFSGEDYGTNIQAWSVWLKQQSPGADGQGSGANSPGVEDPF